VLAIFQELSAKLIAHNQREEESIFPYIKQIESTYRRKEVYGSLFIRTMRKSLDAILKEDHKKISELLIQLRQTTNNYRFTEKACTNHQVMYHKLRELDNDLTQHMHLENNILYPKAIEMEQELLHSNVH
jgi:regulator of cell morphogenesis and NO signaling